MLQFTVISVGRIENYTLTMERVAVIALSTGSLYNYSIDRVFTLAAEIGYDGVEVLIDGRQVSGDPAYLRRLSFDCGLPIVALHSPFLARVHGWPRDQIARLQCTVTMAQHVGVPLVVTHLPCRFHRAAVTLPCLSRRQLRVPIPWRRRDRYYDFLYKGLQHELESATGVIVALENMPAHVFFGLPVNAYWFNNSEELANFPHLTLDTTHLATWGLEPVEVYKRLQGRVTHVHLSNFDGREHRSPLDGVLGLADFLQCLTEDDYPGAITVECSPEALDAEDEAKCRIALKRALIFCKEHFNRSS